MTSTPRNNKLASKGACRDLTWQKTKALKMMVVLSTSRGVSSSLRRLLSVGPSFTESFRILFPAKSNVSRTTIWKRACNQQGTRLSVESSIKAASPGQLLI